MKTIGLLGGMSWESTLTYYRILNEEVRERLGGLHSAKVLLDSIDFQPLEEMQREGRWADAAELLADAAAALERAGAEFLVIGTNTMHKVAPQIEARISIPLLHIADATAEAVLRSNLRRVALLGTRFTMEEPFLRERLEARGLEIVIPEQQERDEIHRVIYEELCLGDVRESSKAAYLRIIDALENRGAEGVILGCTEIGLLVTQDDVDIPVFDTTEIHARAAVDLALA